MIVFHLDMGANVAPYVQIAQQVKHALHLGSLRVGDQLPTMREVATQLAINPNTVLRAYRELEREGIIASHPGLGTFVRRVPPDASMANYVALRQSLSHWLREARAGGLDDDSIVALFSTTLAETARRTGADAAADAEAKVDGEHLA